MKALLLSVLLAMTILTTTTGDHLCTAKYGDCQSTSIPCTYGSYLTGFCDGGVTRKCCVIPGDIPCKQKSGTCQTAPTCVGGSYLTGFCAGPTNRRCCVKSTSGGGGGGSVTGGNCAGANIVTRAQWGARPYKSRSNMALPVRKFFIHHTTGASCTDKATCSALVRSHQNYHINTNGWSDIGYNFLVGEDGNVYEGRGWNTVGAHTSGHNSNSVAIAVIGDFTNRLPNQAALNAVRNMMACGKQRGALTSSFRLWGHRDAGTTACPGNMLYAEIKKWPEYSTSKP